MIRLDFFSSILILLLIVMSVKMVSLLSKIQDETKYTFVTHASSSFITAGEAYAHEASSEDKKEEAQPAEERASEEKHEGSSHNSEASGEEGASKSDKKTNSKDKVTSTAPSLKTNLPNIQSPYSKEEVKILQELSNRRQALDKTEESLNMRANVLKATENKLDQKVNELKALQNQVAELMKGYDEKEDSKYKSLVKIYENMPPRQAAKIFDELDMNMLVAIITRMKEARSAPIIATMHPAKAKELSVELTKHQSLDQ